MKQVLTLLLAALVLTAAYLFAWPTPTIFYYVVVGLHVGFGGAFILASLPAIARIARNSRLLGEASRTACAGWIFVGLGAVSGAALVFTGTRRAEWDFLYAHILVCLAGIVLLLAAWRGKRGLPSGSPMRTFASFAIFTALAASAAAGAWWLRNMPWQEAYQIDNPRMAPGSMNAEGDGAAGLFFPSSAQTTDGKGIPASYFMESDSCKRCHAQIYSEWQGSMHHFSSFNNQWYRKSIEFMQDVDGVKSSKWCAGCHDPALLFSGMMDTPIRPIVHTPAANAGLGCMMCHSFVHVKSTMGQGDYTLEYPVLHRLAVSKNPAMRRLHDFMVELNPEPHRRVFLKPFMRNQAPQFCSACHKVHLDVPVNNYRWIRGFNEYDNWQASGVSGEGARSFYYPAKPQNCADCHMPLEKSNEAGNIHGYVHSHRFFAANTAVPYANKDEVQLTGEEQFLENNIVSVDIFGISRESPLKTASGTSTAPASSRLNLETMFAVGEEEATPAPALGEASGAAPSSELTAPMNRSQAFVRPGETARVDVVVRTLKLGHFFPGGTVDAFDCWLELAATDDRGRVIFTSGAVGDDGRGPVDPGAHFYRSLQIDAHGNPINKRNAWATRAVVYVHLIPPGAADTVHYRLQIPKDETGKIHLQAKLNYRKFSWWNTQFSFGGIASPGQPSSFTSKGFDDAHYLFTGDTSQVSGEIKSIPNLPIVTLAQNQADLTVLPPGKPLPAPQLVLQANDWQRWNDYGIGLLLQEDLKGAESAFEQITKIDPKNMDGWVNLGRVRVQEGDITGAKLVLERALDLDPQLARAHFFYAQALKAEGNYADAIAHLRLVLVQYPRDRVVHNELGRDLFLQRRYNEAIQEFQTTLSIDPEDLEANYNLMLCYTGLNQPNRSAEFEKRYMRFKANESAQSLTGPYLRAHPDDNLERQPIHEHVSASIPADSAPSTRIAAARKSRKASGPGASATSAGGGSRLRGGSR